MTVFDWLGRNPANRYHEHADRPHVPLHLPPDDQPESDLPPQGGCAECPASAVVTLLRVVCGRHPQWKTYEAATVQVRDVCRHHADVLLAADGSPWWEAASREV